MKELLPENDGKFFTIWWISYAAESFPQKMVYGTILRLFYAVEIHYILEKKTWNTIQNIEWNVFLSNSLCFSLFCPLHYVWISFIIKLDCLHCRPRIWNTHGFFFHHRKTLYVRIWITRFHELGKGTLCSR